MVGRDRGGGRGIRYIDSTESRTSIEDMLRQLRQERAKARMEIQESRRKQLDEHTKVDLNRHYVVHENPVFSQHTPLFSPEGGSEDDGYTSNENPIHNRIIHESHHGRSRNSLIKSLDLNTKREDEVDDISGKMHAEDFLDWEARVENYFEWHPMTEARKVKFVKLELQGSTLQWWKRLQEKPVRQGKAKINTWVHMKQKLRKQFLPSDYQVMMHKKFHLRQGDLSKSTKATIRVTSTSKTAAQITNRVHKQKVHFLEANTDKGKSKELKYDEVVSEESKYDEFESKDELVVVPEETPFSVGEGEGELVVVREETPFSVGESEGELVVREETPFSVSEGEDKVAVDWDLPPVYDCGPEVEDVDSYPEVEEKVLVPSAGVVTFTQEENPEIEEEVMLTAGPFDSEATSIVSIPVNRYDTYNNQSLHPVDSINSESDSDEEEFNHKGTCRENCTCKIRGQVFSNKRSLMMEDVPNVINIPILCYDNEIQVPRVAETTSSDLYVKVFGYKETWEENYKSRIRGRILSKIGRNTVTEYSAETLGTNTRYSRERVKICEQLVPQVAFSLSKRIGEEGEAYGRTHHEVCAITNKKLEVSSVIGRYLIQDITEALKNESLAVECIHSENSHELLNGWHLMRVFVSDSQNMGLENITRLVINNPDMIKSHQAQDVISSKNAEVCFPKVVTTVMKASDYDFQRKIECGVRKIVVATDMTDTVTTSNDATFVFDRGRSKQKMEVTDLTLGRLNQSNIQEYPIAEETQMHDIIKRLQASFINLLKGFGISIKRYVLDFLYLLCVVERLLEYRSSAYYTIREDEEQKITVLAGKHNSSSSCWLPMRKSYSFLLQQWLELVTILLESFVIFWLAHLIAVLSNPFPVVVLKALGGKERLVTSRTQKLGKVTFLDVTSNQIIGKYRRETISNRQYKELQGRVPIMAFVFDRGKSKQKPYNDKLIRVAYMNATVGTSSLQFIWTTHTKQLGQKLLGKQRRIWFLAWRATISSDRRIVYAEFGSEVMKSMLGTGTTKFSVRNEDLSFVFDRGKVTGISYDAENISCLMRFRICQATGFVFDRGKAEKTSKMDANIHKASHWS